MSQQESLSSVASGSGTTVGSASTVVELQAPRQGQVPIFRPIDTDDARARAAVEQWRTFTMLLEPEVRRLERKKVE